MITVLKIAWQVVVDFFAIYWLATRSQHALKAENVFRRRQLAMFKERGIKPRQVDAATSVSLALLSRLFN